jgi:predicted metal-dependent peptidase
MNLLPHERIIKARTTLLRKSPFFGILALKLTVKEDSQITDTMATDGSILFYNKDWVSDLPPPETLGVTCHEIMHCALLHPFRRGDRNQAKWNAACDFAINWPLVHDFGYTLPEGALIDIKYANMPAEQIYRLLPKAYEDPFHGGPRGKKRWGEVLDATEINNAGKTKADQEKSWEVLTEEAKESARGRGFDPGSTLTKIGLGKPRIDWKTQTANIIGAITKTDYSWIPPDLIYLTRKIHVPTLHEPNVGHLVIAIDTSASVRTKELKQFWAELRHLLSTVNLKKLTVLQCDTTIHRTDEYDNNDVPPLEVVGRGGTCFMPIFERLDNPEEPTNALIYFTDMGSWDFPDVEPEYPVFWARTENIDAPFGQHIDLYQNEDS